VGPRSRAFPRRSAGPVRRRPRTLAARRSGAGDVGLTPAGEDLEPGFGDEGVDEAGDEVEVFFAEFGDGGDPVVAEGGFVGGASGTPGGVFEEQVVGGDVEDFGEPDDDVGAGGDAAVLVAADLAGVAADLGGEVGLAELPKMMGTRLAELWR
jgi:hypothetical protein